MNLNLVGKDGTHYHFEADQDLLARDGSHYRRLSLPRVTSILTVLNKPGLQYWFGKLGTEEAERQRDEAADIGTTAHGVIDRLCLGVAIPPAEWEALPETAKQSVRAFVRWQRKNDFRATRTEKVVYSLKHGYAGTLDALGSVLRGTGDGSRLPLIADWKTSNDFRLEYYLQLAAYLEAYRETATYEPEEATAVNYIEQVRCVRFDKATGNYDEFIVPVEKLVEPFAAFLGLKVAFEWLSKMKP